MAGRNVFKRYELKFLITVEQYRLIKELVCEHMSCDKYGESDICNLYCDTPDYLLIRRSIEKPFYKEKLRLRSYGVAKKDSDVFVEIKKKYDSVVYKRRILVNEQEALKIASGECAADSQIGREIYYLTKLYDEISPRMFISYRREAFFGKNNKSFRVTFDRSILWRTYDLTLNKGIYGQRVLPENMVLMEIKTSETIPLWLVKFLSDNKIYKTSFSKYGTAYIQMIKNRQGEQKIA